MRGMFKIPLGYLSFEEECELLKIIDGLIDQVDQMKPVLDGEIILKTQKTIENIFVDPKVSEYIVRLVQASRNTHQILGTSLLDLGGSPRASIALYRGSRAKAFLAGRAYVTPQDVIAISNDVLGHRIWLSVDAEMQDLTSTDVVNRLVQRVPQP